MIKLLRAKTKYNLDPRQDWYKLQEENSLLNFRSSLPQFQKEGHRTILQQQIQSFHFIGQLNYFQGEKLSQRTFKCCAKSAERLCNGCARVVLHSSRLEWLLQAEQQEQREVACRPAGGQGGGRSRPAGVGCQCPMSNANGSCPLSHLQCLMSNVQCQAQNVQRPMSNVQCSVQGWVSNHIKWQKVGGVLHTRGVWTKDSALCDKEKKKCKTWMVCRGPLER